MLTDSTVGKPAVMLGQNPDRFYHTSTDTIDKIGICIENSGTHIALDGSTKTCVRRNYHDPCSKRIHRAHAECFNTRCNRALTLSRRP